MKHTTLFLSFILFANILFAQVPGELKWKENIIKNKIHTQTQWNHKYEKGKPKKDGYKNFSKTYDHNGNIIEEIYYQSGKPGSIDQKLSYKYDNKENKIEYINTKGAEGKILFKQNITYDNSGKKIREERYNGSDYEIIKYSYDSKNRISEIVRTDIDGNIAQKRTFEYSNNTSIINIHDGNKKNLGKIINKFDSDQNIIETTEYEADGKIKEKFFYKFQNKLMIEKSKYIFENFNYKETYKHDSKGNMLEILREQPIGNSYLNNVYKYDSNGNLIEEQWYDDDPTEYSKKTYYYNSKGILEKVDVYYAAYKYKMQYRYEYKKY